MTHQSMTGAGEHLSVGRLATPVWQAAVEHLAHGSAEGAPEDVLLEWRAAGIVDGNLTVAADWQQAIDTQERATAAMTLVARMGDVAFLTNLYLCPDLGSAVAVTLRTAVDDSGGRDRIDLVHPQAEVAMSPLDRIWTLLRRVVPPLDAFRTDAPELPGEAILVADPTVALATAESARASVFTYGVQRETGRSEETIWYLADERLHQLSPTTKELHTVAHGNVASGLLTMAAALLS